MFSSSQKCGNMNLRLVLIFLGCANTQPILSQIGQIFENLGFKYVPPPAAPQVEKEVVQEKDSTGGVVFTQTDGWLQTGAGGKLYRLGEEATTYYSAKYYCEEVGGRLAEISSEQEMEAVKSLLRREPDCHYWLGREKTERKAGKYQSWARGEPNTVFSDRCVVLHQAKHWDWAGWNCGYQKDGQTEVRALCQKDQVSQASSLDSEVKSEPEKPEESPRCEVSGVSLTGEDWISRHTQVNSSSQCRTDCLNTYRCNYWTWRSDSRLCYLKTEDGPVVEDVFSVSGTTLAAQGCHNKLLDLLTVSASSPAVEYCSCVSVSHHLVAGYIDPRTLTAQQTTSNYDNLGRLIVSRACPLGQVLSCTDDEEEQTLPEVLEAKVPQPNITDCLVHDVRLSVGGLLSKVLEVPDAPTCHAHCLAWPGCQYWTWRGDTQARKCFLLPHEGRMVRRQGAASGTVRADLGCRHHILQQVESREEEEICDCQPDQHYDLVSTGLIDPRLLPSGRIVNTHTEVLQCPPGHSRVCYGPKTTVQTEPTLTEEEREGPKLWSAGLKSGSAEARNIPKRETKLESPGSAVNFPQ